MGTVPTGKLERELRKLYLQWLGGLDRQKDVPAYIDLFQSKSTALIESLGGQAASLGALADFPVPKTLPLSPRAGTIYNEMKQAAISAGITAGLNSKDVARQMLNAGLDKSYRKLERLARTETTNAYWKNQWASVADLPLLVMVWGSEESKRTCDYCLSRDGLVVEDGTIRDHPNGRCTLIPTLRSRVAYKGTLQPDGSVTMDPAWTKTPIKQETISPADLSRGAVAAEQQRLALEKGIYNPKKTDYNGANGWDAASYKARTSYTEGGAREMNAILRDKAEYMARPDYDEYFGELFVKQIDELAELIGKNQLTDDIVVARGVVKAPGFDPSKLKTGDTFADRAFLSTTTDMKEAADFAAGRGVTGGEGWTFVTKVPKGTNALPGADYQHEIIFKPGQPQKVLGIDHDAKTVYTEMVNDVKVPVKVPGSTPVAAKPAPVKPTLAKPTVLPTDADKLKNAETMYGTGSKQHQQAVAKWGTPEPAPVKVAPAKPVEVPKAPVTGKEHSLMTNADKLEAARIMYGNGSKQYKQALAKWGKK